jgi:hypothetical protein
MNYFCPSCDRHVIDLVDCRRLIKDVKEVILSILLSPLQKEYRKLQKIINIKMVIELMEIKAIKMFVICMD